MDQTLGIITIVGVFVSIIISITTAIIALKKTKPEINNIEVNTEKSKAEIVRMYADELRNVKIDLSKLQEEKEKKDLELENKIKDLQESLNKQIVDRREEQLRYHEFINELLLGITMLTGQIQIKGENPLWSPPPKTPFDWS